MSGSLARIDSQLTKSAFTLRIPVPGILLLSPIYRQLTAGETAGM
jgi:hypothetical protein